MTTIDLILIGLVTLFSLIGLWVGFVRGALYLLTLVAAGVVALLFTSNMSVWLTDYISIAPLRIAVSFIVLYVAVTILGAIVSSLIAYVISKSGLSGVNRAIGLVFGGACGVVLVCMFVVVGNYLPYASDAWWLESQLIPHIQVIAEMLKQYLPSSIEEVKTLNLAEFGR
ncbi:hypothetical protein MNBD_GAMMA16-1490 [hydrothermal vent metagenome]|uniref:Colicin V production protein n=1 Tax=hydrothermal vent metagenome TaxID=652676 RepID=A0A3B0YXS5_9ZZZZ